MYEHACGGKNKRLKDTEMKRFSEKKQTPSAPPSQHVPITAALKQSPARRPILRARERHFRKKERKNGGWCVHGRGRAGQREGGRVTFY